MRLSSEVWVRPETIEFKISPHDDLAKFAPGDWDLERRYPLKEAVKHRSITQRYIEGRPWEETDLFKSNYARRFKAGDSIRGERTMKGLVAQYYDRVDGMFESLKRDGFRIERKTALPKLLIGRAGEIFIGNQGNHRLAMAKVLGLKQIAGEIICRHRMV
jgi:hypothetical protein